LAKKKENKDLLECCLPVHVCTQTGSDGSKFDFPKKSVDKIGKEKANSHTGIILAVTEMIHTAAKIVPAPEEMTHVSSLRSQLE
jgi:hypothetical protein